MGEEKKKVNFMSTFTAGCRKGSKMVVETVVPSVAVAYAIVRVLTLSGIMDLLGKLFTPLMVLFGLPGEAAVPLALGIPSMAAGIGATASLVQEGVLSATQTAMMLPYFFLTGGVFMYTGRILSVTGIESKDYKYCYLINIINAIISLVVMRFVLMLF